MRLQPRIVWPRYTTPQAHAAGRAHIRPGSAGYFGKTTADPAGRCCHTFPLICHRSQQAAWGSKKKLDGADVYTGTASFSQSEMREAHRDAQQRDSSAGHTSPTGV